MPDQVARKHIKDLEAEMAHLSTCQEEEDAQFEEDRAAYEAEKGQVEGEDLAQLENQFNEIKAQYDDANNLKKERMG